MMSIMKHYGKKFLNFKYLIKKDNPIIIEVGAHYGEDTLRFLEIFPNPTIYCFEPDDRNILTFNKFVNSKNVNLIEKAVSNQNGSAEFYNSFTTYSHDKTPSKYDFIPLNEYNKHMLHNSGSSSLKKGYKNCLKTNSVVEMIRLDTWLKSNIIEQIDFIWVDVQGSEFEVIDGLGNKISKVNYLWIEYGEMFYEGAMDRDQTISLLLKKGFILLEEFSDLGSQGDLLFKNKEIIGIR